MSKFPVVQVMVVIILCLGALLQGGKTRERENENH